MQFQGLDPGNIHAEILAFSHLLERGRFPEFLAVPDDSEDLRRGHPLSKVENTDRPGKFVVFPVNLTDELRLAGADLWVDVNGVRITFFADGPSILIVMEVGLTSRDRQVRNPDGSLL